MVNLLTMGLEKICGVILKWLSKDVEIHPLELHVNAKNEVT